MTFKMSHNATDIKVSRRLKPVGVGDVTSAQLRYFASETAFGIVTYLQWRNINMLINISTK